MKKILSTFAIFAAIVAPSFGDDVRRAGATPYIILDRNIAWSTYAAGSGRGYNIDLMSPAIGVCIYVTNHNPTNARTVVITVLQTPDLGETIYLNGGAPANTNKYIVSRNGQTITVPAYGFQSGMTSLFVPTPGAAHASIAFFNQTGVAGGSPDTASVFVVQTSNCPDGAQSNLAAPGRGTPVQPPNQWSIPASPAVAAQATTSRAAVAGVAHTAQALSASLSCTTAAAQANDLVIRDGACGAGTIKWIVQLSCDAVIGHQAVYSSPPLNIVGTVGNAMCVEFSAVPAAGGLQRVDLSGFDQ